MTSGKSSAFIRQVKKQGKGDDHFTYGDMTFNSLADLFKEFKPFFKNRRGSAGNCIEEKSVSRIFSLNSIYKSLNIKVPLTEDALIPFVPRIRRFILSKFRKEVFNYINDKDMPKDCLFNIISRVVSEDEAVKGDVIIFFELIIKVSTKELSRFGTKVLRKKQRTEGILKMPIGIYRKEK